MKTKLPPKKIYEVKQNAFRKSKFISAKLNDLVKGKKNFSTQEKIRIVIEGQSGESTIGKICASEGITPAVFHQWTQEFLKNDDQESNVKRLDKRKLLEVDKFNVVIEGKSGVTSIAEICRRENITQDTFLKWSRDFLELRKSKLEGYRAKNDIYNDNIQLFRDHSYTKDTVNYIENYIDLSKKKSLVLLKSKDSQLEKIKVAKNIVSAQKLNDIRYINEYLTHVSSKLEEGGVFIGYFETIKSYRKRKFRNNISGINNLLFLLEFLVKSFLSNTSFIRKYYLIITKGRNRLISKAEGLGRLVNCGYKIMDYKTINGLLYFVVKKVKDPILDINSTKYDFLYKMPRIGKDGKTINVYKFRTMYPYSEHIQDYVLNANGYARSGKPAEDFRIPNWGKIMRKYWIDELPQILNILKGEMKLVGIRPVSERYFRDIPKEMQKLRLQQKPGCIPPYLSLNKESNLISVLQSEMEYLNEKVKNPNTTDIKFFFRAIYNIIVKKKRSA